MRSRPRTIAIAGGKGGVGKSTVAINLATGIARLGFRTTIVDADLGAANLHTMLGVLRPAATLAQFFDGEGSLDDIARPLASGVRFVPGTSRPGAANPDAARRIELSRAIATLDAEIVIVDVGAGTSHTVVDLLAAADVKLFVLTPQLASLHNGYALVKTAVHRIVRRLADDDTERALIDAALTHDHRARTVTQLLEVLRPLNPELALRIEAVLASFRGGIVGNLLERDGDLAIFERISTMIGDHLAVQTPVMAGVARLRSLAGGLAAGQGFLAPRGDDLPFRTLANRVLGFERATHQRTIPLWLLRELAS